MKDLASRNNSVGQNAELLEGRYRIQAQLGTVS